MMRLLVPYYLVSLLIFSGCTPQVGKAQLHTEPRSYGLWAVDISGDDKFIAVGGDDSLLQILSDDLKVVQLFKQDQRGPIRSVRWHPKKNLLAISTLRHAWLYDMENGKEIELEGANSGSRSISWKPDGELLAMAGGGGAVFIWDKQGKLIQKIFKRDEAGEIDTRSFLGFDWHPTNNTFVTVGDEIRVFDLSGKQINVWKHRKQHAGILSVKWHPSGDFFVTGDYGHAGEGIPTLLQFWKPDGTLLKEITDSPTEFRSVNWSKDGNFLATGSDALRIRDKNGNILYTSEKNGSVWSMDWNKNSSKIITVNWNGPAETGKGNIRYWSPKAKLIRAAQ